MRSVAFGVLSLFLLPGVAFAQQKPAGPSGPARSSSQFTLRREEAGGPDAQIARARMRAGDCAAALGAFDVAIRATVDPALRRDRGLCHEKQNHPYPAIDDYRAYLTARPDAPDNEQIRQRLAALEEQVGVGGPGDKDKEQEKSDEPDAEGKFQASGSASIGSKGAKASGSSSSSGSSSNEEREPEGKSYDYYAERERKAEEAEQSPLRGGEGVILGVVLHVPRWFLGDFNTNDIGYGVAGALRWSTGPSLSLISEFGYAGVGTSGSNTSAGGPLLMGGVELRLPISRYASDQVVLRGGVGYERYTVSGTRIATNMVLGRFGAGFRHVFGPSLAFEILADGGPAYGIPDEGDSKLFGVIGASAGLMVAF